MAWWIDCGNCEKTSTAHNIVDLVRRHLDSRGWILCRHCGCHGFIKKEFTLQEGDPEGTWRPYLRGVIRPGDLTESDVYQPFAFLVSYDPTADPKDVWFCYYKDTRGRGGRLKLGHGPGGPPVFGTEQVADLVAQMVRLGCLDADETVERIRVTRRQRTQATGYPLTAEK